MRRRVDWSSIRTSYINGDLKLSQLAVRFGVRADTVRRKASSEKWGQQRVSRQHRSDGHDAHDMRALVPALAGRQKVARLRGLLMKKKRFSVERFPGVLKQAEVGCLWRS